MISSFEGSTRLVALMCFACASGKVWKPRLAQTSASTDPTSPGASALQPSIVAKVVDSLAKLKRRPQVHPPFAQRCPDSLRTPLSPVPT